MVAFRAEGWRISASCESPRRPASPLPPPPLPSPLGYTLAHSCTLFSLSLCVRAQRTPERPARSASRRPRAELHPIELQASNTHTLTLSSTTAGCCWFFGANLYRGDWHTSQYTHTGLRGTEDSPNFLATTAAARGRERRRAIGISPPHRAAVQCRGNIARGERQG